VKRAGMQYLIRIENFGWTTYRDEKVTCMDVG
jgi:hypothetical protein